MSVMETLSFEPGVAPPIRLRFRNLDRTPIDTTGASLRLRVAGSDEGTCTVIQAVRDATTGEFVIDANAITLPARDLPYIAIIDIDWGTGWQRQKKIALKILEGC